MFAKRRDRSTNGLITASTRWIRIVQLRIALVRPHGGACPTGSGY